jgi:hypothetical protein
MLSTKNVNQLTIYTSVGQSSIASDRSYLSRKDFYQTNGYFEQASSQYLNYNKGNT